MNYKISDLYDSLINKHQYDYHEYPEHYDPEGYTKYLDTLNDQELIDEFMEVYDLEDESEIAENIGYY